MLAPMNRNPSLILQTNFRDMNCISEVRTQRELESSFTRVAAAQKVLDKGCLSC
jgi:hypothetical protein